MKFSRSTYVIRVMFSSAVAAGLLLSSHVVTALAEAITGTPEDDVIIGTVNPDIIDGLGGNDSIHGQDGDDNIDGGEGNDRLEGYTGNDRLSGGPGNDTPNGGAGNDYIDGGAGDDWIDGDMYTPPQPQDSDTLIGGPGDDRFYVDSLGDVVIEKPNEGHDIIQTVLPSFDLADTPDIEELRFFGAGPFVAYGSDRGNYIMISGQAYFAYLNCSPGEYFIDGRGGDDNISGCFNGSNTLVGGDGNDGLNGAPGVDKLYGGSGNDGINGEGGDDELFGGDGDDWLAGSLGSDHLVGGLGNDRLYGESDYTPWYNAGNPADGPDLLEGGEGNDHLNGGQGSDTLYGGTGVDELNGAEGADLMVGGPDDDIYHVYDTGDVIVEAADPVVDGQMRGDTVRLFNVSTYSLPPNVENLAVYWNVPDGAVIYGNTLDNDMRGGPSGVSLYGLEGNDYIVGPYAASTLVGGPGNDVYEVNSAATNVVEEPDGGIEKVIVWTHAFPEPLTGEYQLPPNVEVGWIYTSSSMTIIGSDGDNAIDGTPGNDVINGNGGSDTLLGDMGNDVLTGDTLQSSQPSGISTFGVVSAVAQLTELLMPVATTAAGNDILDGGPGSDTAQFSGRYADYNFIYNASSRTYVVTDKVAGRDGSDTVRNVEFFKFRDVTKTAASIGIFASGDAGANTMNGSPGSDQLYGLDGNDKLNGLAGDDTLDGGPGADIMSGGDGDDSYIVDNAGDKVKETAKPGSGTDTVYTSLPAYTMPANVENLVYTGAAGFSGKGNKSANRMTGGPAADRLDGQKGNDVMIGLGGDDTYVVDSPADLVTEEPDGGIDTVISGVTITTLSQNVEVLSLSKGNINGTGNALDNVIIGSSSQNILSGGDGADTLIGGLGNDTFYGETSAAPGDDADTVSYAGAKKAIVFSLANTVAGQNTGGAGTDRIYDISSIENLTGSAFNDLITGSVGPNVISGADGSDTIKGLAGADVLVGGNGLDLIDCGADGEADRVVYALTTDSPPGATLRDQVTNFTSGTDLIDLSLIDANATEAGDQAFAWGGTTPAANAVWYTVSGSDVIVSGDVNSDAVADIEVLVKGVATLQEADVTL